MKVRISPSVVNGTLTAPPGKSVMQRACALAILNDGETVIINPGKSDDELAALAIIQKLGAKVNYPGFKAGDQERIIIVSPGLNCPGLQAGETKEIDCGESGLSLRMFTPIAAISQDRFIITGNGSLINRPLELFDEILPQLGIRITSNNGKLPLEIQGPLVPADISVDGSISSQFLTGLLIALAGTAEKQVTVTVKDLKSRPYIDLTLQMMKQIGYNIEHDNYREFYIRPRSTGSAGRAQTTNYRPQTFTVEGDWSNAAFFLVAGAIAGQVSVKGLGISSVQADKAILEVLKLAEAGLSISGDQITTVKRNLKSFHFNATDCPDLFPPLVALAVNSKGTSVIEGMHRLTHKESNRALTLMEEFGNLGAEILAQDDLMIIKGTTLMGANVHSHNDHRVAMACAIASLTAKGETMIEEAEAVNKSYPDFYRHLKMIGANVSLQVNG